MHRCVIHILSLIHECPRSQIPLLIVIDHLSFTFSCTHSYNDSCRSTPFVHLSNTLSYTFSFTLIFYPLHPCVDHWMLSHTIKHALSPALTPPLTTLYIHSQVAPSFNCQPYNPSLSAAAATQQVIYFTNHDIVGKPPRVYL